MANEERCQYVNPLGGKCDRLRKQHDPFFTIHVFQSQAAPAAKVSGGNWCHWRLRNGFLCGGTKKASWHLIAATQNFKESDEHHFFVSSPSAWGQRVKLDLDGCEIPPQHVTPTRDAELAPSALPVGHPARLAVDMQIKLTKKHCKDCKTNAIGEALCCPCCPLSPWAKEDPAVRAALVSGENWFRKCMEARGEVERFKKYAADLDAACTQNHLGKQAGKVETELSQASYQRDEARGEVERLRQSRASMNLENMRLGRELEQHKNHLSYSASDAASTCAIQIDHLQSIVDSQKTVIRAEREARKTLEVEIRELYRRANPGVPLT